VKRNAGFTLVELLTALAILSIVGLISYRGLVAVVDTRDRVSAETQKWRGLAAFFERLEHDLSRVGQRAVRDGVKDRPPLVADSDTGLEFSRYAALGAADVPRRIGYALSGAGEIELHVWSGLDVAAHSPAARYTALRGVKLFELHLLDDGGAWQPSWPSGANVSVLPRALRVRVVLATGEDVVRVLAVQP
jgi:general secretion pathway protein J